MGPLGDVHSHRFVWVTRCRVVLCTQLCPARLGWGCRPSEEQKALTRKHVGRFWLLPRSSLGARVPSGPRRRLGAGASATGCDSPPKARCSPLGRGGLAPQMFLKSLAHGQRKPRLTCVPRWRCQTPLRWACHPPTSELLERLERHREPTPGRTLSSRFPLVPPASPPSWNLLPFLQRVSHAATQEWAVSARPGPAQLASWSHFPPHTG